jgi:Zn-dependent peptidase ImmA (M78 family)
MAEVLIHELLHLLRDPDEFADLTGPERELEEGAVTAVTEDLLPRFMLARRGVTVITWASEHPYGPLMRMVRGVSQRATRVRWHNQSAVRWRYRLVKADRDARAAMWARATGVTR